MFKVMIVDDEAWILRGLKRQIEESGFPFSTIRMFEQPMEALISQENDPADLLFVDIRMAGLDGLELIRRAQEICSESLFVIISAYGDFSYAQSAIRLGVEEYLVKPVVQTDLHRLLQQMEQKISLLYAERRKEDLLHILWEDLSTTPEKEILELLGFVRADGLYRCWAIEIGENREAALRAALTEQCGQASVCVFPSRDKHFILAITQHADPRSCGYAKAALAPVFAKVNLYVGASESFADVRLFRNAVLHAQWGALQYFVKPVPGLTVLENITHPQEIPEDIRPLLSDASVKQCTELLARWCAQAKERNMPVYQVYHQGCGLLQALYARSYHPLLEKHLLSMTSPISMVFNYGTLDRMAASISSHLVEEDEGVSMAAVRGYIEEHFREPIHVASIADHFYMDAGYIGRLFRKQNEYGIPEYITKLRMDYAAKLLRETSLEVNQIARSCGVSDYFYFAKVFKKAYLTTPTSYRQNQK